MLRITQSSVVVDKNSKTIGLKVGGIVDFRKYQIQGVLTLGFGNCLVPPLTLAISL